MEDLAHALYGSTPEPAAVEPTPAKPSAAELHTADLAERMYGEEQKPKPDPQAPAHVATLRATTERQLYSAQSTHADAISEADLLPAESTDEERTVATQAAAAIRELMVDVGISAAEGREFVTLAKSLSTNPLDAAAITAMQTEASQALIDANHGDHEAAQRDLDAARQLVARDPRIKTLLAQGLGNHPKVVITLVARARAERLAGRL